MPSPLDQLAVSPSGFIFDPGSGATFTANPTAQLLLEGVRDGRGLAELTATLTERFALQPGVDLQRDILEFVRVLQEQGLLDRDYELGA